MATVLPIRTQVKGTTFTLMTKPEKFITKPAGGTSQRPSLFEGATGLRKVSDFWFLSRDGDETANEIFARHYSRRRYTDGRPQKLFVGPGQKMVLIDALGTALFVWRKFKDGIQPPQEGVNCAVFRNESSVLSSVLIQEAMEVGWRRWPGTRFYTLVNSKKIRSTHPGFCFIVAGWHKVGLSKGGLVILARDGPP